MNIMLYLLLVIVKEFKVRTNKRFYVNVIIIYNITY